MLGSFLGGPAARVVQHSRASVRGPHEPWTSTATPVISSRSGIAPIEAPQTRTRKHRPRVVPALVPALSAIALQPTRGHGETCRASG